MTRRIVRPVITGKNKRDIGDDEVIVVDDDSEELPPELESIKQEFGGSDYTVAVYKMSEDKTSWDRIRSYPLDQFNPDLVAEKYGGGKFKFRVFNPQGKISKQWTQNYATPILENKEALSSVITQSGNNGKDELINLLRDELKTRSEKYEGIVVSMINAIQTMNRPTQNTPIEELLRLKALFPDKDNHAEITSLIEILKTGLNLGKEVSSGINNSDKSPEDLILTKLADAVLPMLLQKSANMKQSIIPQSINPQSIIPIVEPVAPPIISNEPQIVYIDDTEKYIMTIIEQNINGFITFANKSNTVPLVADYIVSQLTDEKLDKVGEYFKKNPSRIFDLYSNLKPYEMWVNEVIQEIIYISENIKKEQGQEQKDVTISSTDRADIKSEIS
jgi:hypothetical protein